VRCFVCIYQFQLWRAYIYSNCEVRIYIPIASSIFSREVLPNQFFDSSYQLYSNSSWWSQEFGWGAPSAGDGGSTTVLKDNESGLMGWRRRRTTEIKYYAELLIFIMSVTSVHQMHERISVLSNHIGNSSVCCFNTRTW